MKFRISLLAVVVIGLLAATAASAVGTTRIVFSGKYAGQASTKVDGNTVTISANGAGTGSLIGAGKIVGAGTGDSSQQPCVPFAGTGKITGTAGTIAYKVISGASGCGDEGGHVFAVKGYMSVLKATGKLARATGKLKFTGTYDRDGGTFNVKLTGALTK